MQDTETTGDSFGNINMDEDDFDWNELGEFLELAEDSCATPPVTIVATNSAKSKSKVVKSFSTKKIKHLQVAKPLKRLIFPSFDKSDATLYFPCTFARLINNGDMPTLSTILKSRLSKSCEVSLSRNGDFGISLPRFIALIETGLLTKPDIFVCMHDTKVVDNQITAELYFKYTDSPEMHIYPPVDHILSDPFLKAVFVGKRRDLLAFNLQLNHQSKEKREEIQAVIDRNENVQMYGTITLSMAVDDITKKITSFAYIGRVNALSHDGTMYRTECF